MLPDGALDVGHRGEHEAAVQRDPHQVQWGDAFWTWQQLIFVENITMLSDMERKIATTIWRILTNPFDFDLDVMSGRVGQENAQTDHDAQDDPKVQCPKEAAKERDKVGDEIDPCVAQVC